MFPQAFRASIRMLQRVRSKAITVASSTDMLQKMSRGGDLPKSFRQFEDTRRNLLRRLDPRKIIEIRANMERVVAKINLGSTRSRSCDRAVFIRAYVCDLRNPQIAKALRQKMHNLSQRVDFRSVRVRGKRLEKSSSAACGLVIRSRPARRCIQKEGKERRKRTTAHPPLPAAD